MPRNITARQTALATRLLAMNDNPRGNEYADADAARFEALALKLARSVLRHGPAMIGRAGGQVRSEAKAEAARRNGAKGGRPRRQLRIRCPHCRALNWNAQNRCSDCGKTLEFSDIIVVR